MGATKSIYKVIRSILFTTVLVVIGIIAAIYIVVSIPAVQNIIRDEAEKELSAFLGGRVDISKVEIKPFNEIILHGVSIYEPGGKRCISAGRIGAGINLWQLVKSGTIEIAYAEIISLDAKIRQDKEGAPLNIDFLIQAFSSKDKNNPPPKFRLVLRNVVIRKSSLSFDKAYKPVLSNQEQIDFNHLELFNLRADIAVPLITNDDFTIDLRRLAFEERSGLVVNGLTVMAHITPEQISFNDFALKLNKSKITISDQILEFNGFNDIKNSLRVNNHDIDIICNPIVPSELSAFYNGLNEFTQPAYLDLSVNGNLEKLNITDLKLDYPSYSTQIELMAQISDIGNINNLSGNLNRLKIKTNSEFISKILAVGGNASENLHSKMNVIGNMELETTGSFNLAKSVASINSRLRCDAGNLDIDVSSEWNKERNYFKTEFNLEAEKIDLHNISGVDQLGEASLNANGEIAINDKEIEGVLNASVPYFEYNSVRFENISLDIQKNGKEISGNIGVDDDLLSFDAELNCLLASVNSQWLFRLDLRKFIPEIFKHGVNHTATVYSGLLTANITGNNPDNLAGMIEINDFEIKGAKKLNFNDIIISGLIQDDETRYYKIESDILEGEINGKFKPVETVTLIKYLLSQDLPAFIKPLNKTPDFNGQFANIDFTLKPNDEFYSSLNIPFRPGVPIKLNGHIDGENKRVDFNIDAPYIIQGKNKLIKNSNLNISLKDGEKSDISLKTLFPLKKANANLALDISLWNNHSDIDLGWIMENNELNHGNIGISLDVDKDMFNKIGLAALINRSEFILNDEIWHIYPASIKYSAKELSVNNLQITNNKQFIDINGKASDSQFDMLNVELSEIDLNYIFEILNINYVNFGGIASGKAHVADLFSKSPLAYTEGLYVKDLKYNDCLIGDGDLEGHWDNANKMIAINADLKGKEDAWAKVKGAVYITKDSLAFDFDANKIDIGFMKPFVDGFTSDIKGIGSGHVSMFGTYHDIDLVGKAYADSVSLLVDYTNVYYTGKDTVFFTPGKISIPRMQLNDRYGNTCMLQGVVTHEFLHNARFNFEVKDADHLMVYDTSSSFNSMWYGRVFANGSATIRGVPGLVSVNLNMSTADNSVFTLVLDENETAANYTFLTFSDKKKQAAEALHVEESFEEKFLADSKKIKKERPTVFSMDLALEATPGATIVIIMDPKAGDKITGNGHGPLLMHYDTDSDNLSIYGKYTLLNGNYNFSLQELILRNFTIQEGSSISFNGDPLRGILDITASYRVNTNLTDLDESFKNDPDLNRTSVPVDALLKVTGEMESPEINFDLALPTVTSDVERKLRSIVSTDDMMNQQIMYLLALNRFYSPTYTGASQGGELASVASSTISSQIQNLIGTMTDKFSVAPSFKSEKDNFSDLEVDVALSSSLFDNRLLINGNLGYRDKSTSQTTFIGDFDIEYLLSRDGKLRLKAYNHFNDASYYLKSALTTQGIGIVYRKDFDDPFSFIKRWFRRRKDKENKEINKINQNKQ